MLFLVSLELAQLLGFANMGKVYYTENRKTKKRGWSDRKERGLQ